MKLLRNISILAVGILLITCMAYAADSTVPKSNIMSDLVWLAVTAAVSAASSKFFSWLSGRLAKAKYMPPSVVVWIDQVKNSDIADAVMEARKLIGMTPAERIAWARKYLQDRYAQLPSSVANQMLETKIQEIIKTPALNKPDLPTVHP